MIMNMCSCVECDENDWIRVLTQSSIHDHEIKWRLCNNCENIESGWYDQPS